jgi:hypothetical protein
MNSASDALRNYLLAHSVYAADKRYAEKLATRLGRRIGRDIYVLRLGQVHGELQGVSRLLSERAKIEGAFMPATPSYSVFAFTIAEALVSIAKGKEAPGRYTVVSKPAWSWLEVLRYYGGTIDNAELNTASQPPVSESTAISSVRAAIGKAARWLGQIGNNHRCLAETAASYLISHWPDLEYRLEALRRRQQAAGEISDGAAERRWQPYPVWPGAVPGRQLISLSDSRITMEPFARQVRDKIVLATRSPSASRAA